MQFTTTISFFGIRETNKITSSYTCRVKDAHIHTNTQTRSSKNGLLRGQKKQEVHIDTCLHVFFLANASPWHCSGYGWLFSKRQATKNL